jgi:hypothetical protein
VAVVAPERFAIEPLATDKGTLPANGFTILPGQRLVLEIRLSSRPAALHGRVLAPDGQPAIGAVVLLQAQDSTLGWRIAGRDTTTTNAQGEYRFDGLPAGSFRVLPTFEYQRPEQVDWSAVAGGASVRLSENDQVEMNLQL